MSKKSGFSTFWGPPKIGVPPKNVIFWPKKSKFVFLGGQKWPIFWPKSGPKMGHFWPHFWTGHLPKLQLNALCFCQFVFKKWIKSGPKNGPKIGQKMTPKTVIFGVPQKWTKWAVLKNRRVLRGIFGPLFLVQKWPFFDQNPQVATCAKWPKNGHFWTEKNWKTVKKFGRKSWRFLTVLKKRLKTCSFLTPPRSPGILEPGIFQKIPLFDHFLDHFLDPFLPKIIKNWYLKMGHFWAKKWPKKWSKSGISSFFINFWSKPINSCQNLKI